MNWNGYYYKILNSWVPALFWAPRWLSSNSYPTLTDYVEPPTAFLIPETGSFTSASSSTIPVQWVLTESTPGTGLVLQRFLECFIAEKEALYAQLLSLQLTRQFFFDTANPEYAWIFQFDKPVDELYVQTTSGTVEIVEAQSDYELFYSAGWRYKQSDNLVLIYGLDIQTVADYTASGDTTNWHYLNSTSTWASGEMTYMEHPVTKNWIPLHPLNVRRDGYTSFIYDGNIRFRASSSKAAKLLDEVIIYANGERQTARRVSLPNSIDEKGLYFGINRRYSESNTQLAEVLLRAAWFRGQTKQGVRNFLSAALRTGDLTTFSPSANTFSIPATATGYTIRHVSQYGYVYESLSYPASGSSETFYTMYASGTLPCAYINGMTTTATVVSGIVSLDTYINNKVDRPLVHWRLQYWTDTASAVTITDNYPKNISDLIVFFSSKVNVISPSETTLKKSFNKTSPSFRWSRSKTEDEVLSGLAEFDF